MTAVLPPSAGDGHRQADEGLHQPDRQEALQQLPVGQQPQQPVQRLVKTCPQGALQSPSAARTPKALKNLCVFFCLFFFKDSFHSKTFHMVT